MDQSDAGSAEYNCMAGYERFVTTETTIWAVGSERATRTGVGACVSGESSWLCAHRSGEL
eukprot:1945686-Pyramimonas_sp.AAC.1